MPPGSIDIDVFAELYRRFGDTKTWVQYAQLLSESSGRTIKPNQLTAFIARHREKLRDMGVDIRPKRVDASNKFPWPTQYCRDYWHTYLARYLFNLARVETLGIDSLDAKGRQRADFENQRSKYIRERLVVRLNPLEGFYLDKAHRDEAPAEPESIKYFNRRYGIS